MNSITPLVQDHVILLLSSADFEDPPSWLTDNFNIIEGGTHTGQPSRNKLIYFSDGTYLELFNWIAKPPTSNAWADKSAGLIDFALTSLLPSTADSLHEEISSRLQEVADDDPTVDFRYTAPQPGGRIRKDGVHVQWKLSRPIPAPDKPSSVSHEVSASGHRKDFPFFTHDVTPRSVRVPFDEKDKTTHPCGATGISAVELTFPKHRFPEYVKLYQKLLGIAGKGEGDALDTHVFEVRSPVEDMMPASRIILSAAQDGEENSPQANYGGYLRGLRLYAKGPEGHNSRALGSEGIASTVSLEW